MAKAKDAAPQRARESDRDRAHAASVRRLIVLSLLILVPLSVFMLPITLMLAIGLLPTAVAYLSDRDPDKLATITVAPMNIAGLTPLATSLFQTMHDSATSMDMLSRPINWMIVYLAAGAGWTIFFAVPPVVARLAAMKSEARIAVLKRRLTTLVAEWTPAVTRAPHGVAADTASDTEGETDTAAAAA